MTSTFKVVLLGEGRVGKTSLVSRFVNDRFSDTEASTVQAGMYSKLKVDVDGRPVNVSITDTAGQERYHALGPIYYRNSSGAVLVYDITDADTFERAKSWLRELHQVVGENIQIVLCGNKGDMERDREVALDVATQWAASQGALHFTTSAKTGMNVGEAFTALFAAIVRASEADGGGGSSKTRRGAASASSRLASGAQDGDGTSASRPKRRGVKIDVEGTGHNVAAVSSSSETRGYGASPSASYAEESGLGYRDDTDGPDPAAAAAMMASSNARSTGSSQSAPGRSVSLASPSSAASKGKKEGKSGKCCD